MSNIVPQNQGVVIPAFANAPAKALARVRDGGGIAKNFTEGVGEPMDILSIKGKNFREKIKGQDPDPRMRPAYEYDCVILDGSPNINKTYYVNNFVEGSMEPPDCWSLNGIKPDTQAPSPQSPTCRGCKWNVFGSRVSVDRPGQQSKSKACADSRRIALLRADYLAPQDGSDPDPLMLRIPATSLQPLKAYAKGVEQAGLPVNAVVTRLGFDGNVAHPQLTFTFVRVLTEAEYDHVEYLTRVSETDPSVLGDERVRRILEAPPPADDVDPAEHAGQAITNRNDAPVVPAATMPQTAGAAGAGWKPGATPPGPVVGVAPGATGPAANVAGQAGAAPAGIPAGIVTLPDGKYFDPATGQYWTPPPPPPPAAPAEDIIALPDGRMFNRTTGQFVDPAPAPVVPPQPPADAVKLPDGRIFVPSTNSFWGEDAAQAAPAAPQKISEQAKVDGPQYPVTNQTAPGAGWKPAAKVEEPFTPPQFLMNDPSVRQSPVQEEAQQGGPIIEGAATEAAPAQPKRRKPPAAPAASNGAAATQEAPKELDALLADLKLN